MKNALGIIFGNIHEKEMPELTTNRTLGSVPFGGRFRLIDFALSNMANSGIEKIGIITKSNYQSLMRHVGSGKSWDLSRKNGGVFFLPPFGMNDRGAYSSRMEALSFNKDFIKKSDEKYVVMSDCDNVCNIDFDKVVEFHNADGADITVIYRKKTISEGDKKSRLAFESGEDGRIITAKNKILTPGTYNVFTNMLVIDRELLLEILDEAEEKALTSFSSDVIVGGVGKYRIFGYELDGYFAGIDSISNYFKHSMELLDENNREALFDNKGAKIITRVRDSAPCKLGPTATVVNSVIADGCKIDGEVENCVLFRGVEIKKGAKVTNSVLFQNTVVESDSRLNCVISDKNCKILANRMLSGHSTAPYFVSKGSII